MAEVMLPALREGSTIEQRVQNLTDNVCQLKKELEFLLQNVDSLNVTSLNTNVTKIKSDKGTTEIKGPLLVMKDKQTVPVVRVQLGYDATQNKFVFELYDPNGDKTVYLDENGTQVLDGQLLITYMEKILLHAYKDANGGRILVNDNNGNANVRMGSEGTTGDNVGGIIELFNDGLEKSRVQLGIFKLYDAGALNLKDSNKVNRARVYADSNVGPVFALSDESGNDLTYLTLSSGKINNQLIATETVVQQMISNAISDHIAQYHSTPPPP